MQAAPVDVWILQVRKEEYVVVYHGVQHDRRLERQHDDWSWREHCYKYIFARKPGTSKLRRAMLISLFTAWYSSTKDFSSMLL
jgi:hypothetical protein